MKNTFLQKNFGEINENKHNEKYEVFELQLLIGKIKHSFLKKEISIKINGERYYDLTTSNSYGGPVITDCSEDNKWELVDEFQRAFQEYCLENNVISEYVRFDPMILNVLDFTCIYEVECIGQIRKTYSEANSICVGKKIWNEEIYKEVCAAVKIGIDADFFPAYRFNEQKSNLL